jgi:hypothetical protein
MSDISNLEKRLAEVSAERDELKTKLDRASGSAIEALKLVGLTPETFCDAMIEGRLK